MRLAAVLVWPVQRAAGALPVPSKQHLQRLHSMDFLPPARQAEIRAIADKQQKNFRQMLVANKNKTFAIHAIRTLHTQIDELVEKVQKRPDVHFDCKPGCTYCCHFRIEAFAPEIFIIARRLKKLPGERLDVLITRLREHAARAEGVRMVDFQMVCPMLEDDRCSVYEDRPSICRKYLSLDVEECKKWGVSAPEDGELVLKSSAMVSGTQEGYAKAKRPLQIHELGQSLLIALTDPSCEDRWYAGEQVFPLIPEAKDA
jgi:uncharacterized protein